MRLEIDTALGGAMSISIHAPRVGCDVDIDIADEDSLYISIHAPRVGCDHPLYFYPETL